MTLGVQLRPVAAAFTQPLTTPRTVLQTGSLDFSAVVSGSEPINRAWSVNGTAVNAGQLACGGASVAFPAADVLRLSNVPLTCEGAVITLGIDNRATAAGQRPTATALLNVTPLAVAPVFSTHPASAAVDANLNTAAGTASFNFTLAAGNGSVAWQWLLNGQPLTSGSAQAGNGVLQAATVRDASGTLGAGAGVGASGTLTLSNVPLAANGATLSVHVTRTVAAANTSSTSQPATLTVNTGVVSNAITATQVVAGNEWSMVLRPDRTVWAWGGRHRNNGTVQVANLAPANQALRPQAMYPQVLTDVHAVAGWTNSFWALKGTPGTAASRVLHWGNAAWGTDGRGTDGNGGTAGQPPGSRYNEAAPVEVLESVNNLAQPVDRVCAIAGGSRLLMIRAISSAGITTNCNAGSAKTVWIVGSMTPIADQHNALARALPGLPADSPPAQVFFGSTSSGSPPLVITLEDGRLYGHGDDFYNGLGMPLPQPGNRRVGDASGPQQLPASWGAARSLGMSFFSSLFVVRVDGSVMSSGYNSSDELGLGALVSGTQVNGPLPLLATSCAATPCTSLISGVTVLVSNDSQSTLALQAGQILGWGSGAQGLLGPGVAGNQKQSYPRPVPTPISGFTALSSAQGHALAIGPGQVVYAWGSGLRGALGDGVDGSQRSAPQEVLP